MLRISQSIFEPRGCADQLYICQLNCRLYFATVVTTQQNSLCVWAWFGMVKGKYVLRGDTQDNLKFHHVLSGSLMSGPPPVDAYTTS
jgi:hypothetical protein